LPATVPVPFFRHKPSPAEKAGCGLNHSKWYTRHAQGTIRAHGEPRGSRRTGLLPVRLIRKRFRMPLIGGPLPAFSRPSRQQPGRRPGGRRIPDVARPLPSLLPKAPALLSLVGVFIGTPQATPFMGRDSLRWHPLSGVELSAGGQGVSQRLGDRPVRDSSTHRERVGGRSHCFPRFVENCHRVSYDESCPDGRRPDDVQVRNRLRML
jgi:hypothetical protein